MLKTQTLLFFLAVILSLAWFSSPKFLKKQKAGFNSNKQKEHTLTAGSTKILQLKAAELKAYAEQNNYNASICFLVDMTLPSGHDRFFVYDLSKDSIRSAGLVTHGNCNQEWLQGRKYGNVLGCGCTSLGKYKVGNQYYGQFGLAFKLHGLDKTNDKSFARYVVLHSHSCVPESEIADDICQSNGCPTVSPGFLQNLKTIINTSKKPILLWIYE